MYESLYHEIAKVSLDRFTRFLNDTELLDEFVKKQENILDVPLSIEDGQEIGFRDASFTWSAVERDGKLTPSSRHFTLSVEGELLFKRNCINMIVGPT